MPGDLVSAENQLLVYALEAGGRIRVARDAASPMEGIIEVGGHSFDSRQQPMYLQVLESLIKRNLVEPIAINRVLYQLTRESSRLAQYLSSLDK